MTNGAREPYDTPPRERRMDAYVVLILVLAVAAFGMIGYYVVTAIGTASR